MTKQIHWTAVAALLAFLTVFLAADPWIMAAQARLNPVPMPVIWLTEAGNGGWQVVMMLLLFGAGWVWGWKPLCRAGGMGMVALTVAGLATQVLKHILGLPRPDLWEQGVVHIGPALLKGLDSFPSGHAATSFALAVLWGRTFHAWRWPLWIAAGAISLSRVAVGSHFPSDILGGSILGAGVGWILATGFSTRFQWTINFWKELAWVIHHGQGWGVWYLLFTILLLAIFRGPALSSSPLLWGIMGGIGMVGAMLCIRNRNAIHRQTVGAFFIGLGISLAPGLWWVPMVFVGVFIIERWAFTLFPHPKGARA